MCGRYITAERAAAERVLHLGRTHWKFEVSNNVPPAQQVPVVRFEEGEAIGTMMRWGLIPFFGKGQAPKYSTINARIETVETAGHIAAPGRGQRCIQPSAGFYEWHLDENGRKAPYLIQLNDQDVFGFAALWDRSFKAVGAPIESVAHITMPGNDLMRKVHKQVLTLIECRRSCARRITKLGCKELLRRQRQSFSHIRRTTCLCSKCARE